MRRKGGVEDVCWRQRLTVVRGWRNSRERSSVQDSLYLDQHGVESIDMDGLTDRYRRQITLK